MKDMLTSHLSVFGEKKTRQGKAEGVTGSTSIEKKGHRLVSKPFRGLE